MKGTAGVTMQQGDNGAATTEAALLEVATVEADASRRRRGGPFGARRVVFRPDELDSLLDVLGRARSGDFEARVTGATSPAAVELAARINDLVDLNQRMCNELARVGGAVGQEGRIGERAVLPGAGGGWQSSVESVNALIDDLMRPTTEVARVLDAVANGDLTRKMALTIEGQPVKGEYLRIGTTVNAMVDQLSSFADEVTRVAREVGTEGRLGGQAEVRGVSGTWKDLTDSVNGMASNLTDQVRSIAEVTTAVARGDLTRKVTINARGEIAELKDTINTMVDQLSSFSDEVTRVAKEVGTEGRLGGQAEVRGVSGVWRDLTDNVNQMASNLTTQVRGIVKVVTAVAEGDLDQKFVLEAKGEVAGLAETINDMIDKLRRFSEQVTEVAREVGTEGRLGGQADVPGVSGTWKDLTDSVNSMASNLTDQVRDIALVTTAVANGDLSQKITADVRGEMLALKDTVNEMVDNLRAFSGEVTRVAREVGTEGRLGGQADVPGVSGTWKDLTDNVNQLADNLTRQVRNIAEVTTAVAQGDLTRKITVDARGEILELKNTMNTMVDQLSSFADEVTRVAREVGNEGRLGGQAAVRGVSGTWKDLTDNVNQLADNLTTQVRNIAEVTTAVARGDLTRTITVEARGEIAELKDTINTMVDQLSSFAAEVTRVAKEVGTEGTLGGQAEVAGVSGTWRHLTDNVNQLANNLTTQVRNIAEVTTAVARGDLTRKITVEARGEIAQLKETMNTMVDQLSSFADEVTRVAKEVGTEGKLGGQAKVSGVSGTWKDLTDNVNQLAGNLTTQVRAIAEVSTAVTEGDLTRQISVEASGEVAELSDNINQMIANLAETTRVNAEQDWLNVNLARFSSLLQGQRDLQQIAELIMRELTPLVEAQHGAFFIGEGPEGPGTSTGDEDLQMRLLATWGLKERKHASNRFGLGEGLVGQAALERQRILVDHAPADYVTVNSGLGEASPLAIVVIPLLFEDQVMGVVELGSFTGFAPTHQALLDQLTESIGVVLNSIVANTRTEALLEQSQSLANELQEQSAELQQQQQDLKRSNQELEEQAQTLRASEELLQQQQEELQQTNEELEEKATLLAEQYQAIEEKNTEIERARQELEEQASQLALSSRYKSEFLANMSHELRTPLNSLLILSKLLGDNPDGNLDERQVEFARTIYGAGNDLLELINDILDLSKVEAGKMEVDLEEVPLEDLAARSRQAFEPIAHERGLTLEVKVEGEGHLQTDGRRVQQVLKNLLSNACKFTEQGTVSLTIAPAAPGTPFTAPSLRGADDVISFEVHDTGIGIPEDKLRLIFEAFQQAEGGIARRYGGTGLGLSISREIARLLGGEIHVRSTPEEGSTFTLYLPRAWQPPKESSSVEVHPAPASVGIVEGSPEAVASFSQAAGSGLHVVDAPEVDLAELRRNELDDDRDRIEPGDRVLLVVEDDETFATMVMDYARSQDFRVVATTRGDIGWALAHEYRPDAIALDIRLPGASGWSVLDRLKHHPATRHIPVHVFSAVDERSHALRAGAAGFQEKPISPDQLETAFQELAETLRRDVRRVLVVEDDKVERESIVELIASGDDVEAVAVASAETAWKRLQGDHRFDCMVLDLKLPRQGGFALLEQIRGEDSLVELPIIVYTGRELTRDEEKRLRDLSTSIIVKDARSPERLLDETALFLHRVESRMPAEKRRMLEQLHAGDDVFVGKRVLVVDDDVRNVFALTSLLEGHGMVVGYAENGRAALEVMEREAWDLVIMDVMMPEMDGYEATEAIRAREEWRDVPVIALTAKAMKGDRERSIASGASDYITKPVDTQQLLSLMRVWLSA